MTRILGTLVDSNVWIDVFGADEQWGPPAKRTIARCLNEGGLFINPIIYAEVSNRFNSIGELDAVLPAQVVDRETLPYTAAFLAGKAFQQYKKFGGTKRTPLPDLYIGAHAMVRGLRLLTRDTARFKTYYPKLEVIGPE